MKRYSHLTKEEIYEALNKLRDAMLAAKDGNDVEYIMKALLTSEERLKLGRRILIAQYLVAHISQQEITRLLKVSKVTINSVQKSLSQFPEGFDLIEKRSKKVGLEYQKLAYKKVGASKLIRKKTIYTGIRKRDIER